MAFSVSVVDVKGFESSLQLALKLTKVVLVLLKQLGHAA